MQIELAVGHENDDHLPLVADFAGNLCFKALANQLLPALCCKAEDTGGQRMLSELTVVISTGSGCVALGSLQELGWCKQY